jgi:hypothetical protein
MAQAFKLSDKGQQALKGNDETLTPGQRLLMEIVSHCGQLTKENCLEMANELINHYGSQEAALQGVRDGEVTFRQED